MGEKKNTLSDYVVINIHESNISRPLSPCLLTVAINDLPHVLYVEFRFRYISTKLCWSCKVNFWFCASSFVRRSYRVGKLVHDSPFTVWNRINKHNTHFVILLSPIRTCTASETDLWDQFPNYIWATWILDSNSLVEWYTIQPKSKILSRVQHANSLMRSQSVRMRCPMPRH